MPQSEEKIMGYVLLEKTNKRYLAHRGYTTQKKYAKWFILEDAEEKQRIAAEGGVELVIEPVTDDK